jgi:hypothetical protein
VKIKLYFYIRLDDRGSRVRFPAGIRNFSGAHPASYPIGTRVLSLGVKRLGRETDHSPPSSVEVKECVELYLHPNTPSWRDQLQRKAQVQLHLTSGCMLLFCLFCMNSPSFVSLLLHFLLRIFFLNLPYKFSNKQFSVPIRLCTCFLEAPRSKPSKLSSILRLYVVFLGPVKRINTSLPRYPNSFIVVTQPTDHQPSQQQETAVTHFPSGFPELLCDSQWVCEPRFRNAWSPSS